MRKWILLLVTVPVLSVASAPGPDNEWEFTEIADPSGAGSMTVIRQSAGNTVRGESTGVEVTPELLFGCAAGRNGVTAHIDWQRFISSFSTEVGFKVDDGRFTWLKWKLDGSEEKTLSPSVDDTAKLIAAASTGKDLLVEVSPYSESPVTATFDLSGFEDAIARLGLSCSEGS